MTLDFIVVNDKAPSMETKFDAVEQCLELEGLRYKRVSTSEEALVTGQLDDSQPIPQNTVLYIHGNFSSGYQNVGLKADLAQERPDLRFIIQLDDYYHREEHFVNPDDFLFAKERLENQTMNDQIIIVTEDFLEPVFFGRYARQPRIDIYIKEIAPHIAAHHLPNLIRQQQGYHIYIVHDEPKKIGTAGDMLDFYLSEQGVAYTINFADETRLEKEEDNDRRPFPEDALLLIHGNMFRKYPNLKRVIQSEEKNNNLRYLLFIDRTEREHFQDEQDYRMVQGFLEIGFDPNFRINILPISIAEFINGAISENSNTEHQNFHLYFNAWQQQRNV
jgi:hypothetical protein